MVESAPRRTSFRYVYIPADVSEPIQQQSLAIPEGKDVECLLDHLKAHFGGEGMSASQKEARKKALLEQLGADAQKVDMNMLNMAADMQMVENVCLLPNHRDVSHVGVNMYTDDQAQAKQLPWNPRASSIAECCGKLIQVRGDAFIARIFDNDDGFERLDFDLPEVSSSAAWVQDAKRLAVKRDAADLSQDMKTLVENSNKMERGEAGGVGTGTGTGTGTSTASTSKPKSEAEVSKDQGNACVKRGDWQGAVDRYTRALELDPDMLAACSNRALAQLKLGRLQQAVQDCDKVLSVDGTNVKALLRRAAAHEGLGQADQAAEDYTQVLRTEPVNREAAAALDRLKPAAAPVTAQSEDTPMKE